LARAKFLGFEKQRCRGLVRLKYPKGDWKMKDLFLRISDALLGALWLWALIQSLRAGRIGGQRGFQWTSKDRPLAYWSIIALLALMVLHFVGLAIVGQFRAAT
jgi:predicted Co/Zn/Cd cation transporter (cation efflux family)